MDHFGILLLLSLLVFLLFKKSEKQIKTEEINKEEEEAIEWIAVNGSNRLRKGVKEGLIHYMMMVYYDERIKLEIGPNWNFISSDRLTRKCCYSTELSNPTESELDVLATVKKNWTNEEIDFLDPELKIELHRTPSGMAFISMCVPWNFKIMAALLLDSDQGVKDDTL